MRSLIVAAVGLVACGADVSLEAPGGVVPNRAPACAGEQLWFHEIDPELVQIEEVHQSSDASVSFPATFEAQNATTRVTRQHEAERVQNRQELVEGIELGVAPGGLERD